MQANWFVSGSPYLENSYIVRLLALLITFLLEYKSKTDSAHEKLYSLSGGFVKDEGTEQFSKKLTVYSFTLYFAQKSMKLYTIKKEEKDGWVKALKEAIGYSNLYDYYIIGVRVMLVSLIK